LRNGSMASRPGSSTGASAMSRVEERARAGVLRRTAGGTGFCVGERQIGERGTKARGGRRRGDIYVCESMLGCGRGAGGGPGCQARVVKS
jgi:hypothetical protein